MNKYLKTYIRNRSKTKNLRYFELKYIEDKTIIEKSMRSLIYSVPFEQIDDFFIKYENEIINYLNSDDYINNPRWRKGERSYIIMNKIRNLKSYNLLNKETINKLNKNYE